MIAIIPARGGSKGLSRKNLALLGGKPLIAWTIETAKGAKLIDRVIVSTEDAEIASVARENGVEVIDRPAELATDRARIWDVVDHALSVALKLELTLGEPKPDHMLLQPTSPLRTAKHIDECIDLYNASMAFSAISVCVAEHHPFKMLRSGMVPLYCAELLDRNRQSLPKVYRQNGAIYVNRFVEGECVGYVMSQEDSVDVDSRLDLIVAEAILTQRSAEYSKGVVPL